MYSTDVHIICTLGVIIIIIIIIIITIKIIITVVVVITNGSFHFTLRHLQHVRTCAQ